MRYAVEGVHRSRRVPAFREFTAESEPDAVRQAGLQGLLVKKIWRIPDDAPPFRPPAPAPRGTSGCAPLFAVFCYLVATLSFITALALGFGVIAPISARVTMVLWVLVPGILLLITGALFHMIKLLKVIVARTGPGAAEPIVRRAADPASSQVKPAP